MRLKRADDAMRCIAAPHCSDKLRIGSVEHARKAPRPLQLIAQSASEADAGAHGKTASVAVPVTVHGRSGIFAVRVSPDRGERRAATQSVRPEQDHENPQ